MGKVREGCTSSLFIYCIFISTQSVGISIDFVRRTVVNHWWSIHIFTTQQFRSYHWRFLDRQHHNVGTSAVWCNQSQTWLIPMGQWDKDWGFSPNLFAWDANRWKMNVFPEGSSRRMDGQEEGQFDNRFVWPQKLLRYEEVKSQAALHPSALVDWKSSFQNDHHMFACHCVSFQETRKSCQVISFNATISSMATWIDALLLFNNTRQHGHQPSVITSNSLPVIDF